MTGKHQRFHLAFTVGRAGVSATCGGQRRRGTHGTVTSAGDHYKHAPPSGQWWPPTWLSAGPTENIDPCGPSLPAALNKWDLVEVGPGDGVNYTVWGGGDHGGEVGPSVLQYTANRPHGGACFLWCRCSTPYYLLNGPLLPLPYPFRFPQLSITQLIIQYQIFKLFIHTNILFITYNYI